MTECKDVVSPMEVNSKLSVEDASPLVDIREYIKLVGSLIFCVTLYLFIFIYLSILLDAIKIMVSKKYI